MSVRYVYLAVEGPHDVELVGRLLKPYGFARVKLFARLAPSDAVGILLDADSKRSPAERFKKVHDALSQLALGLDLPARPGVVSSTPIRCGMFVLPDNVTAGTLEDLLQECAALNYPGLLAAAQALVGQVQLDDPSFTREDMEEFRKPAGTRKATVACIAGVLKPGKAIQMSIQDNRWLEGSALALPRIVEVQQFLKELLALP